MPAKNKHTNNIFNGQLLHLQADKAYGYYGEAQGLIGGDYKEVLNLDAGYYMQAAGPRAAYRYAMPDNNVFVRHTGNKMYELTDHLGNVRATVSDACKTVNQNGSWKSTAIVHNFNYYYPFGMPMPGLYGPANSTYRFGFNGQEKTDEIAGFGNRNTAQFWEYDTRTGRRWNLDPKPQISISDYATFANNPILNSDPLGDIWDVSNDVDTKNDVKSLTPNNQYITFDNNGRVGLDFGKMKQKKIDRLLANDEGLKLIHDLINAKETDANGNQSDLYFYYSTSAPFNFSGYIEGGTAPLNFAPHNSGDEAAIVINGIRRTAAFSFNASITEYGKDNEGVKRHTLLPKIGYHGQVAIAPGSVKIYEGLEKFTTEQPDGSYLKGYKPVWTTKRSALIYHELRENWYRTQGKKCYLDAHAATINLQMKKRDMYRVVYDMESFIWK